MIDIDRILAAGGAERIDLMRYCVISINMEPLFLFLAGEYRLRPGYIGALGLYDVFCAPGSDARLSAYELLPPRELALSAEVARIRASWQALQAPPVADEEETGRSVAAQPGGVLFDALVRGVRADANGKLQTLASTYDPQLEPHQNLPGGRMSAVQRRFLDQVWVRFARPRLTQAGFWQVATIG